MAKKPAKQTKSIPPGNQNIKSTVRLPIIDALRGLALLAMFAFHFSFDLNYFGFIHQNFYQDLFWINSRTLILSSFLLLMGISLFFANQRRICWPQYWRRLMQIGSCAVLVSTGSYLIFAKSWIYFGVLHHMVVASLLGLLFLRFGYINLFIGVAFILLGVAIQIPLFDRPFLRWIGLMTHKPITEDYVPLLPWFGIVLIGIFIGKQLSYKTAEGRKHWQPENPASRLLVLAGKHSLLLYMAHQPIFIGLLQLVYNLTVN